VQETVSLFNFIKYLLIRIIYFCKIYLHVFFFLQHFLKHRRISSKSRYMSRISMRKYALTFTDKFLDIVVRSTFHVQIAIGDNQGNHMFIPHARSMQISSD